MRGNWTEGDRGGIRGIGAALRWHKTEGVGRGGMRQIEVAS